MRSKSMVVRTVELVAMGVLSLAAGCLGGGTITDEECASDEACAEGELNDGPKGWERGRILVEFSAGLSEDEQWKILNGHGAGAAGEVAGTRIKMVQLPPGADEDVIARVLAKNPHVKFAELDRRVPAEQTANDPYYGSAWHLAKMGAPAAWDVSTGTGITVAILDTGVDSSHPDLVGQMVPGWNFYDNNSDTSDVHGHGTQVAGTVAAASNNAIGVTSIAWNAKLMPMRVAGADGYATWSALASSLTWAADHGARVANMSFVAHGSSTVQAAANYMKNKGGIVFDGAGNSGAYDATPNTDSMVTVAATDSYDVITTFSTWGDCVDLAAPGSRIWSTVKGGTYSAVTGTSYSSPVAAAVATLMMSANPRLAPAQVESLLKSTAVDLGTAGYDQHYGYGRVNAAAAVQAAATAQAGDTQAPTVSIASPTGGTVSGLVAVSVSASDNVGVTQVELLVNGAVVASDTTAPFAFSWDSSSVADGAVTLTARARDAAGNTTVSAGRTLTVANTAPAPDTIPPTVSITNPLNGSVLPARNVTIAVAASDNVAVTQLTLTVDGVQQTTSSSNTLSWVWNARKAAAGAHTITAIARDAAGNQATTSINVTR